MAKRRKGGNAEWRKAMKAERQRGKEVDRVRTDSIQPSANPFQRLRPALYLLFFVDILLHLTTEFCAEVYLQTSMRKLVSLAGTFTKFGDTTKAPSMTKWTRPVKAHQQKIKRSTWLRWWMRSGG